MSIKDNMNLRGLGKQIRNTFEHAHIFLKKNKKNVTAACMLLLLAGIAYAAPRAVVSIHSGRSMLAASQREAGMPVSWE